MFAWVTSGARLGKSNVKVVVCVSECKMAPQLPFHRWGGIPLVVRLQLFSIGEAETGCILCGSRAHGIHLCPQLPSSRTLWEGWDRLWLLLLSQELAAYALSSTEDEYRRRASATFSKRVVDGAAVPQFLG